MLKTIPPLSTMPRRRTEVNPVNASTGLTEAIWAGHLRLVHPDSSATEARNVKQRMLLALERLVASSAVTGHRGERVDGTRLDRRNAKRDPPEKFLSLIDSVCSTVSMPRFPDTTSAISAAQAALHRRVSHVATKRFVANAQRALPRDGSVTRRNARRLVARLAKLTRK